ncbi:MAG: hypothetical protein QM788_01120 [Roseateles sp.]|uniref:hypothetical protein n=1 Tax=Roseateles sp. TaxID=1971397 RepID=UPI0039ED85A3
MTAIRMAWRRLTLAGLLAVAQAGAAAQAVQPARLADVIEDRTAMALLWGDWGELERLYAAAREDMQRSGEGWLAICLFGAGADRDYRDSSQAYHDARLASTLDWARRRPDSPLAHAMHLDALVDRAWFYRGGGFANTVSEQRFAEFRAKLNEALAYAQANAAVMTRDNYYVRPMMTLLRGLGVPIRQQLDMARKSMRGEAADECLYNRTIDSLLPKWGGDAQQLERWIRESMKGLPGDEALMRYTRLYDVAATGGYEQGLFGDSLARWPLMRDGLKQWIARSPNSRYWRNRLAYFACMAQDRETAVPALEAIEGRVSPGDWGATGQRNHLACKRWALQG